MRRVLRPTKELGIVLLLMTVPQLYAVYGLVYCFVTGNPACMDALSVGDAATLVATGAASYLVAGVIVHHAWPRLVRHEQ